MPLTVTPLRVRVTLCIDVECGVALVWFRQEGDNRYEVRSAGNTRRLYTNGVFHSQYNPLQPVTGNVWDLLLLPAYLLPAGSVCRVLVLGVGGGAVIRLLNHFIHPAEIVGVELNPVHLEVAREFFGVEAENVELVEADARYWLRRYRGEPFDMIIDDIFSDQGGDPQRAVAADAPWFRSLLKLLSPEGVLVVNFGSRQELQQSAYFSDRAIGARFASAFALTTPLYENVIGAFVCREADSATLRQRLRQAPELNPERKGCRLNYRIRRIAPGEK